MQIELNLHPAQFPLIIGIFLSLLSSQLLIWRHLGNKLGNRILSVIILVMGFVCMDSLVLISVDELYPIWLIRISGIIATFYGPLLYFYIKAFTTKDFKFRPRHAFHLLPALIFAVGIIIIFQNETEFWERFQELRASSGNENRPRVPGLVLIFLTLFYFVLSFRLLRKFRTHVKSSSSFIDQTRFRWLMFLFGILLLPILSACFSFFIVNLTKLEVVPGFGASVLLLLIHLLYILKPEIFSGYPLDLRFPEEEEEKRYESSPLSSEQKELYLKKLLQHMEAERSFLKSELTLSELAQELKMNTRYLSQVINEKKSQNFMDFINGYRIELAKELLLKESHRKYTVLAIAHEVGFKSRSAFYEAFRKQTGTTPSAYKKHAKT